MTQSSSSSPITVSSNINDNNYIDSQIGYGFGSFQNDGVLSNNDGGGGSGNTNETKFGFQINEFRQNPLVGTVQIYDQHVFLYYKNPQVWPPHVEAAEFDRLPRLLSVAMLARKAQMKKQMEGTVLWWLASVMGGLPLLLWLLWSWNEIRFLVPLKTRMGNTKIPPGQMGLSVLGELLNVLWYFKIVGRPDDFIISKRERSVRYLFYFNSKKY
ncbi:hypothetical protein GIB67_037069 [Kingdonia uniflora]|uniref:Uncharacterized protein n=1 Tax=Kingdonia uniflora TaxID=39325 RepID=A0A7J7LHK9_9MAGN|nr:hypothetical protein GIB67_037069 [Kingdonia uniflora]